MVFKNSQAFLKRALATFVIGDLYQKCGGANQGFAVKTTLRPGSIFQSDNAPQTFLNLLSEFLKGCVCVDPEQVCW